MSNRGINHRRDHPHHCRQQQQQINESNRYFVITLTNYPHLLTRTSHFQQSEDLPYIEQREGSTFLSHRPTRSAMDDDTEAHEAFLYNALRFELKESIRAYLQRTRRLYPINFVFDLSNIHRQQ